MSEHGPAMPAAREQAARRADVRAAREDVARLEQELAAARRTLQARLLAAQTAGATIGDLMGLTGYSKRGVLKLLAAAREQ